MTVADLEAERAALAELLAADPRARTDENFRRRNALDRRIARWRAEGPPRSTRRQKVTGNGATGLAVSRDIAVPDTTLPGAKPRTCEAPGCGKPIPEHRRGRKVRADVKTCSDACRQALRRARAKAA